MFLCYPSVCALFLASFKSIPVLPFLVPAYPGCPGKEAVKQVVAVVVVLCVHTYVHPCYVCGDIPDRLAIDLWH